ncbi:MAG: AraC family transcriptional regulator [Pseudomonadota bacterium]|nr:AraC family transcriptional regulator [Pseudomonadota bacterium]
MTIQSIKQQVLSGFEGVVYYRARSILLLAPTLCIGPGDKTHKRKCIRLLIGCRGPVKVGFGEGQTLEGRVLLLGDDISLSDIEGIAADVALLDFSPATAEYLALFQYLAGRPCATLEMGPFEHLVPRLQAGQDGSLQCRELGELQQEAVMQVTGMEVAPLDYDSRIVKALRMIDEMALGDISLSVLSRAVNLSADRFRHLFKETTGCTVSQYARQTALWRALNLITQQGYTITAASHALGFHDVSHFYRVYSDLFGISLSERSNPRKFRRVRCFD